MAKKQRITRTRRSLVSQSQQAAGYYPLAIQRVRGITKLGHSKLRGIEPNFEINKIPKQNGNTYARSLALLHHKKHVEAQKGGPILKDAILGGQDGLVNVLGIVLGVATATNDFHIILVSGLAATFAESISMGAVVYTSTKAAKEYYYAELEREKREIENVPDLEIEEIHEIYYNKGFRGRQLEEIVKKVTSNKELWLSTMMSEELRMFPDDYENPLKKGIFVGIASLIGSFIPLLPYFIFSVQIGTYVAVAICAAILFGVGVLKAKWFELNWWKSGAEMALIGTVAALIGYVQKTCKLKES